MLEPVDCKLCTMYIDQLKAEIKQISESAMALDFTRAANMHQKIYGLQDAYKEHQKIAHSSNKVLKVEPTR